MTPKSGGIVAGLRLQDFEVLDNNVARPIASFTPIAGLEAPVEVVLLIDAVNARYDTVAYARDQIDRFLLADGGELPHPVTLAVLTDTGLEVQSSGSRDGNELKAKLDQFTMALRTIRRSAGIYGAEDRMNISLQALDGLIKRAETKPGRKIILWVSPGWPLISGPRVDLSTKEQQRLFDEVQSLSTRLRTASVTLFSIDPIGSNENPIRSQYYKVFLKGVTKASNVDLGDLALQVLATQSGGLALAGSNDVSGLLKQAMNDSRAYYELGFEAAPADHPGEYHRVDVKVDKPGLVARTRTGYYSQP